MSIRPLYILLLIFWASLYSCGDSTDESTSPTSNKEKSHVVQQTKDTLQSDSSSDVVEVVEEYVPTKSDHPLQLLIDSAQAGDTLMIPAGTYRMSHHLVIDKPLTIIGVDKVEILNDDGFNDVLLITSDNVSLINLRLRHEIYGKRYSDCEGVVIWIDGGTENTYIEGCDINGCGRIGVCTSEEGWKNLTLIRNDIHNNSECAIFDGQREYFAEEESKEINFVHNRIWGNKVPFSQLSPEAIGEYGLLELGKIPDNPVDTSLTFYLYDHGNWDSISIVYKSGDTAYEFLATANVDRGIIGGCSYHSASYYEGFITIQCSMRAHEFAFIFKYSHGRLQFVEEEFEDLNQWVWDSAAVALKRHDPVAYIGAYTGAQYFHSQDYHSIIALNMADSICAEYIQAGNYRAAAQLMNGLAEHSWTTMSPDVMKEKSESWLFALSYHLQAEMFEECVDLGDKILERNPNFTEVLLPMGDALYMLDQKPKAAEVYQKFQGEGSKKGLVIPERVKLRIEEAKGLE